MPLLRGRENIGRNIKEMIAAGHPKDQAVAAALDMARKGGAKIAKRRGRNIKRHYT